MSRRSTEFVTSFEDKYGDTRTIHRKSNGVLAVKRETSTPALALNQPIAQLIGKRIRAARLAKGMTMEELATRAGMVGGHPKNRIWSIENALRNEGMRMGTLYALAIVLEVEPRDLMPPVAEVRALDDAVEIVPVAMLKQAGTS